MFICLNYTYLVEFCSSITTYADSSVQDGIRSGANLLHAVEVLVSGVCLLIHMKSSIKLLGYFE